LSSQLLTSKEIEAGQLARGEAALNNQTQIFRLLEICPGRLVGGCINSPFSMSQTSLSIQ
jgi:hypothetical protein